MCDVEARVCLRLLLQQKENLIKCHLTAGGGAAQRADCMLDLALAALAAWVDAGQPDQAVAWAGALAARAAAAPECRRDSGDAETTDGPAGRQSEETPSEESVVICALAWRRQPGRRRRRRRSAGRTGTQKWQTGRQVNRQQLNNAKGLSRSVRKLARLPARAAAAAKQRWQGGNLKLATGPASGPPKENPTNRTLNRIPKKEQQVEVYTYIAAVCSLRGQRGQGMPQSTPRAAQSAHGQVSMLST